MSISRGKTVNLGNYESARYDVMMEVELDHTEDHNLVFRKVLKEVNEMLITATTID
jgi:hypothetical protein